MYVIIHLDFNGTISGRHLNLEGGGQVAAQQMHSQAEEIVRVIQQLHQKGNTTIATASSHTTTSNS